MSEADDSLARLRTGSRVAGYLLEERVGKGGMGVVFRARHELLDRIVALKILAPELASDEEFRSRFVMESQAATAVDDPHIIPVYDAGEANGTLFIAMRYVPGGDVHSLVRRLGPLSPARAAVIVSSVASALDAAHNVGLVHRDVKPSNLLVDVQPGRPDHVYVSDFGLSKDTMFSHGLTASGQFVGTPDFTAPEQMRGDPVDGRADQYSLACAAYVLLTAAPPYPRDDVTAVIWAHMTDSPPALASRRPDLPGSADRVLARALAKEPAARYETCREFAGALVRALDPLRREPDTRPTPAAAPDWDEPVRAATAVLDRQPSQPSLPGNDAPGLTRRRSWRRLQRTGRTTARRTAALVAGGTAAAMLLIALLIVYLLPGAPSPARTLGSQQPAAGSASRQAAASFLAGYARASGQVVRSDQGGDTVSEGQAYGMLLAEVSGDNTAFRQIWSWTQSHLQQRDGLFAFHASPAGSVIDSEPASDADLLIAWALLRYHGPGSAAAHRDGRAVASAILAHEVTTGPAGVPILTAGPWATGRPASLNPGYWSLPAMAGLARLTGNARWSSIAAGAVTLTRSLSRDGRVLPPDWAELTAAGVLRSEPAPGGSQPQTEYGPDAQRIMAWFGSSCIPGARSLTAKWWPVLSSASDQAATALQPGGSVVNPAQAVLPLVASAAAAKADGDGAAARRLLERAGQVQRRYPTYYGGAWDALGTALMDGSIASGC